MGLKGWIFQWGHYQCLETLMRQMILSYDEQYGVPIDNEFLLGAKLLKITVTRCLYYALLDLMTLLILM